DRPAMKARILYWLERAFAPLGRLNRGPLIAGIACLAAAELFCLFAFAAQSHRVVQRGRAFNYLSVKIAPGDSLEFSNEDEFIHQIYVQSPALNFDSAEQPPGQIISVRFPTAGNFEVRCHIHPKMLLKVAVE